MTDQILEVGGINLKYKTGNNNNMIFVIISMVLAVGFLSWRWVEGIDYMHKNHPDYKGDDLFGPFDEDDKDHVL
jgi:hypothetical protein